MILSQKKSFSQFLFPFPKSTFNFEESQKKYDPHS